MKNAFQLTILLFLGLTPMLTAQNQPGQEKAKAEVTSQANSATSIYCLPPCPCQGAFNQIKVYYFGANNAKVEVFASSDLSLLITTFNPVNSGQLLTISAAGLLSGVFGTYIYLRTTKPGESPCVTKIYSLCPTEAWPGALDDLNILGKAYGDFTVFSRTDSDTNAECNLDNVEEDWHVGGNIIGPVKNTLGTRTNENMVIITNDLPRGVVTQTGNFGIGTTSPSTRLEVAGNTLLDGTLDVNGITRVNNNTGSTAANDGALIVTGGTGIGHNLNVGGNFDVNGTATVGNNLTVEPAGVTRLQSNAVSNSTATGALVVTGGTGIGGNLNVGANLDVDGTANVGNNLTVEPAGVTRLQSNAVSNSTATGALVVTGGTGIGGNLNVGANLDVDGTATIGGFTRVNDNARITGELTVNGQLTLGLAGDAHIRQGTDLVIENTTGPVRIEASNTEMLIITNTQVEAKKRFIVTGADLAERFTVNTQDDADNTSLVPGMLLSIDRYRPGELRVSNCAYDKTVAGIASGAGGIQTAIELGQPGSIADGKIPVAIAGRVYCCVDATYGAVEPGDLLTSSPTRGHAMKVSNFESASGAVIGKAMTALPKGKGLVLMLISMQ